jgi:hypothetical protein
MKVLLGAMLVLLVGCSGVAQAQGEDTDAQITALTERVAQLEAESDFQWEIIQGIARDPVRRQLHWRQVAQEFDEEAPAIARLYFPDSSGRAFDLNVEHIRAYAPSYLALGCLEGIEPTPQYFRDGINQTGNNSPGDIANWVIGLMVDEIIRLEQAGEEPSPCLQTYISPESMAEGKLALDMRTRTAGANLPTWARESFRPVYINTFAPNWFNESDRQMPFICWLFDGHNGDIRNTTCARLAEDESPE